MKNMKKEFKTRKQVLQFCNKNNIEYSKIKPITKTVMVKRVFDNIVYREYTKEITVYTVTL
jgi:hypothetical protein